MIDWLRRMICRCPEPEPTVEQTAESILSEYVGGPFGVLTEMPPPPDSPPPERHLHVVPDE